MDPTTKRTEDAALIHIKPQFGRSDSIGMKKVPYEIGRELRRGHKLRVGSSSVNSYAIPKTVLESSLGIKVVDSGNVVLGACILPIPV